MRMVTGTFSHETNTFSNIPTTLEEFAKQGITHGEDIPRRFRGTNTIEAACLDYRHIRRPIYPLDDVECQV